MGDLKDRWGNSNKQTLDLLISFTKGIANLPKSCLCGVEQTDPKDNIPKGTCMICQAQMLLDNINNTIKH